MFKKLVKSFSRKGKSMKSQDFDDKNHLEDPFFFTPNLRPNDENNLENRKCKTGIDENNADDGNSEEMKNMFNNKGRHLQKCNSTITEVNNNLNRKKQLTSTMIFKRDKIDSLKSSTTQKSVESLRLFIEYYNKEDKTLEELLNLCDIVYNRALIKLYLINKGNLLKKPKCKWQDVLMDQLNSIKEANQSSNEWIDKTISQLNDSPGFDSDKNWETEFYGINYCNIVDRNHIELIKEYVSNEVEYDAGPIFRSYEKEPESLKMFISSTVESLNNLIPKVIERNPFERQFKKHKRMCESFVTDLTKYYT